MISELSLLSIPVFDLIYSVLEKFLSEISVMIAVTTVSMIYRYRNKIVKNKKRYRNLEQRLYGFEKDDTKSGFIPRTDKKVDKIESEVEEIKETVYKIDGKIDGEFDDQNNE